MQVIKPLWDTMPLQPLRGGAAENISGSRDGSSFFDVFKTAIDSVKETDAEKNQMEYLAATGQLDNPAALAIASSKAQLSVQLLVQLRDKALTAYNEITRISL